ncbi:hypothetical protein VVYB158_06610 [Vibrio vulnificus CladeA-yb158]|nr:hypothetical protein VVYB158_06610 [Vibrio vulnificus CladeA-yb158]
MELKAPQKTNQQHQKALLDRHCHRANFQQINRFLKQKIQPQKKPENDFRKPERFKIEVRNPTKNTPILTLNILFKLRFPHWQLTPN